MKNIFTHFSMFIVTALCAFILSNAMADGINNRKDTHTKHHATKNTTLSTATRFSILSDQFAMGLSADIV